MLWIILKKTCLVFAHRFQNLVWFVWGSIWTLLSSWTLWISHHSSCILSLCVLLLYLWVHESQLLYLQCVLGLCLCLCCSVSFIPNALSWIPATFAFLYYHSCIAIVFSNLGLLCDFFKKKYALVFCILWKYILEIRLNFLLCNGCSNRIFIWLSFFVVYFLIKLLDFWLNSSHPSNHFHRFYFSALRQLVSILKNLEEGTSWYSLDHHATWAGIIEWHVHASWLPHPPCKQQLSCLAGAFFASIALYFCSEMLILFML